MKLIYRGDIYQYNPSQSRRGNTGRPIRATQRFQEPYTLIYRGQTLEVNPKAFSGQISQLPMTYELIYRGNTYGVHRDAQGSVAAMTQLTGVTSKSASNSSLHKADIEKLHQQNIVSSLQRRLKAAQERGDRELIELLKVEQQQITAVNH